MNANYEFDLDMYKTVAKNIKKYREARGLLKEELASYALIDEKVMEHIENLDDDINISIYDLYKISVILDVSIEKFFLDIK